MRSRPSAAAVAVVLLVALVGTSGALAAPARERPSHGSAQPASATGSDPAAVRLAGLTLSQRVGQLLMIGTPATRTDRRTLRAIRDHHVGNVMLTGRSSRGRTDTRRLVHRLERRATTTATGGVRLLVATDQEGGAVQVLRGPGFSDLPSARRQGRSPARSLEADARRWSRQLRRAGVTMNLAPVADTVARSDLDRNEPIGATDRAFGTTSARVASRAAAFARGSRRAGVVPVVKHFPGLGRVTGNTDDRARVVDRVTRRGDPYLHPFRRASRGGPGAVMMSSAVYTRLDRRRPAVFSPVVIGTVLRGDLGWDGVVMSDDLSRARAVARWSPGERAVRFVAADGDLVLAVDPTHARPMHRALLRRARSDPSFRAQVDAAALRVLRLKQARASSA